MPVQPAVHTLGLLRMQPRDPNEPHRSASSLELFFDLVFVVAVSVSSSTLHHLIAEGHVWDGIGGYLAVFFAVWWAWLNFTWFGTSFAVDDWLYRVTTIVQMAGALVLAAGASAAMTQGDFTVVTVGYVVMRLAMVSQWLRAAASSPTLRDTALRFAVGITVVQIAWVARLALPPELTVPSFLVLVLAELAVPVIAERGNPTPWHAHHIAERYGLFTLILLGESILASANAIIDALDAGEHIPELVSLGAVGLLLAAGMWWVYFSRDQSHHITTLASSFRFGYFHYVIFAAAGAYSSGIEVMIDAAGDSSHGPPLPGLTVTVPVALFVTGVWVLTLRASMRPAANAVVITACLVIAASGVLALPGLSLAAIAMVGIVFILERTGRRLPLDQQGVQST